MHQENRLNKIINTYPDVWLDYKRFKALLMDFFPEDKITRNLLLISSEEKIPEEIKNKMQLSLQERKAFSKRIVSACNCNTEDADRIVGLWIEAFGIYQLTNKEFKFRYIDRMSEIMDLEIPTRSCMVLKRSGIVTIQDLIDRRHEIMYLRNMGRKSFEDVARVIQELGYDTIQYPIRKSRYVIDERKSEANRDSVWRYLVSAKSFNDVGNQKMCVHALEKATLEGFKGDYVLIILAYYSGAVGIKKDLEKAFFYAWKWKREFECRELYDLASADEMVDVLYILLKLLMDGYGRFDEETRNVEINKCIQHIIAIGFKLTPEDTRHNLFLASIGMGCCTGKYGIAGGSMCELEIDVPLGYQALTLASDNGTYTATKALMHLFYDEDYAQLYREKNQGAYEYLADLYLKAWNQSKEELIEFWDTAVFDKVNDNIDIMSLELPTVLKIRLKENGINSFSDIKENDFCTRFKDYGFEAYDMSHIVAAISQYVEESENA